MKGFFIKKSVALILTTIVLVGFFSFSNIAQAILYSPGATLNPACLPTDLNCDVLLITSGFQPTIATGTTAQYFRGDLSLSTFPTLLSSFTNDLNYLTKVFTSGPFTGAGTSTSPLAFLQASSTADGYLSQIDWNIFNNKLSTTTAFTTYVPYSYASSTFSTYTYASSTYYFSSNPSGYISSTTSALNNYPTYTYASSTYYFASNPNSYITATALTPYLSTTSAALTYLPISASTSLAYVKTESDPVWMAASSSYAKLAGAIFTGTISSPNFSGTSTGSNTGDVTLVNNTNGLTLSGQALTLGLSGASATGTLSATDWNTFNNKLSTAAAASTYVPYSYASSTYASTTFVNSTFVPYSYASSTFPTYTYASSTYYFSSNPSGYISSTTSSLNNYPTYTYASSTYYFASNPNSYITATALTPYLSTTSAASTYVPYTGATIATNLNNKSLANVSTLSVASTTAPTGGVAYFNGNVGIGTASPTATLHVSDAVSAAIKIQTADVAASITNAYDYLSAIIGNATLVLQRVSGNIGIGTTTPASKLDIYGTAGTADILGISSSSNARFFTVSYNGSTTIASLNQAGFVKSTSGGALYNDTNTYLTTASAGTTYVPYSYASSTFPTYTYASSTYYFSSNPSGYISSTTSSLNNYPTYTYASTTFATIASYPTYTYASSTFLSFGYASSTFAQLAGAIFTGTISSPNFSGTSTGSNTGDVTLVNNINGLTLSGQALTLGLSGTSATGTLSATDWNTFNNKLSTAAAATTYVPYTGATTNVDLNTKTLSNVSTLSVGSATAPTGGVAYFNGNVGIGTTSPTFTLDVQGVGASTQVKSTTGTNYAYTNYANGSDNMYVGVERSTTGGLLSSSIPYAGIISTIASYPLQLGTNATARMTIDSTGNVGIGTTSPSTILDIGGGTTTPIFNINSSATGMPQIRFQQAAATRGYIFYDNANSVMTIGSTGGTPGMHFSSTDNVGIGAINPGAKLDIYSASQLPTSGTGQLYIETSDTQATGKGGSITFGGSYTGTSPTTWAGIAGQKTNSVDGDYSGYLQFVTRKNGVGFGERMRIDESGNVGIGTTTPVANLHVSGAGPSVRVSDTGTSFAYQDFTTNGATHYMRIGQDVAAGGGLVSGSGAYSSVIGAYGASDSLHLVAGGAIKATILSNGNVGIGTANPTLGKLQIANTNAQEGAYVLTTFTGANAYGVDGEASGANTGFNNVGLYAYAAGATNNYGIQIAGPASGATNYAIYSSATAQSYFAGNVGIGTTGPNAPLHVHVGTNENLLVRDEGVGSLVLQTINDANNARTQMYLDASSFALMNGNVGIGTATPGNYRLAIDGGSAGSMSWGSGSVQGILSYDPGKAHILAATGNSLNFGSNGVINRMVMDTSGNVGIGTTTPDAKLRVDSGTNQTAIFNGTVGSYMRFEIGGATLGFIGDSGSLVTGGSATDMAIDVSGAHKLQFGTADTARMTIDSVGKVGIGVVSPTYPFEVVASDGAVGTNRVIGDFYKTATDSGGSSIIRIGTTGNTYVTDLEQNSGTVIPTYGAYTDFNIRPSYSAGGNYGNINFITGNGAGGYQTVMTIGANGQKGNVGIGTTTPATKLHIFVPTTGVAAIRLGAGGSAGDISLTDSDDNLKLINYQTGASNDALFSSIRFYTNNDATTPKMTVNRLGNVGIGIANPAYKFEVDAAAAGNYIALFKNTNATAGDAALLVSAGVVTDSTTNLIQFTNAVTGTSAGNITRNGAGAVAYNTTSDRRTKENISLSSRGLSDLMKLSVDEFNFKEDDSKHRTQGLIAQDVVNVYPEAVSTNGDDGKVDLNPKGRSWGIDYGRLTPLLIKAIQDQQTQIMSFVSKIEAGIAYLKNIVVETLAIGSQAKPAGITMYDQVSGNPYCVKIINGVLVNQNGACNVNLTNTATVMNAQNNATTSVLDIPAPVSVPVTISASTSESNISTTKYNAQGVALSAIASSSSSTSTQKATASTSASSTPATPPVEQVATSTAPATTTSVSSASTFIATPTATTSPSSSTSTGQVAPSASSTPATPPVEQVATSTASPVTTAPSVPSAPAPVQAPATPAVVTTTPDQSTSTVQNQPVTAPAPQTSQTASSSSVASSTDSQLPASVLLAKIPEQTLLVLVLMIQGLMILAFGLYVYSRKGIK